MLVSFVAPPCATATHGGVYGPVPPCETEVSYVAPPCATATHGGVYGPVPPCETGVSYVAPPCPCAIGVDVFGAPPRVTDPPVDGFESPPAPVTFEPITESIGAQPHRL